MKPAPPAQVVRLYVQKMLNYERQCFGFPAQADYLVVRTCNNCDGPMFGESSYCVECHVAALDIDCGRGLLGHL